MKHVKLIMEGTTDWAYFKPFIEAVVGEEIEYDPLNPNLDRATEKHDRESKGCLGVKRMCEKLGGGFLRIIDYVKNPPCDAIVIHLDADVAGRSDFQSMGVRNCPCPPAIDTCNSIRELVKEWIGYDANDDLFKKIIIVIPSKATEAWLGIIDNGLFINECTKDPAGELVKAGKLKNDRNEEGKIIKHSWQFAQYAKKHFVNNPGQSISKLEGVSEEASNFIISLRSVLSSR